MDITPIVQALIGICMLVVTGVIVPLGVRKLGADRVESVKEMFTMVYRWATAACAAAEAIFRESGCGEEKREYVTRYITDMCARYGLSIDMDTIRQAIEQACRELGFVK